MKKLILALSLFAFALQGYTQNVNGILYDASQTVGTRNTAAAFQVNAQTQTGPARYGAFLMPVVALTSDITGTLTAGLQVYQTTAPAGVYYYNGTAWVQLTPSTGGTGYIQNQNTADQSADWRITGAGQWGGPTSKGRLATDQGSSIELGGTGVPYLDFTNDLATDFDARIQLNTNDMLSISGASVGIGTTAPGALLDVRYLDAATNIYRASDASGQYRWRVDQGFDMFLTNAASTDLVKIGQGTSYFNSGFVGVGTNSPQTFLHVKGNAGTLNLEGTNHSYIQWYPDGFAAGRKAYTGYPGAGSDDFTVANEIANAKIALTTSGTGNVIVNSLSGAGSRFVVADLNGNLSATTSTGTGIVTGSGTATQVAFWSGTNTLSSNANMYWDNVNSRLGLGTNTPGRILHLSHSDPRILSFDTDGPISATRPVWEFGASGGNFVLRTSPDYTTFTEKFTFDYLGNLGINTTAPGASVDIGGNPNNAIRTAYLNISANNAAVADRPYFRGTTTHLVINGGGTTSGGDLYLNYTGDGTTGNVRIRENLFVMSSGNVGIGTSAPQSTLDVITPANSFVSVGTAQMSPGQYAGIHFGYREANTLYRKSAIVFERTDNSGGGGNAAGKIHFLNGPATGAGSATLADSKVTIGELGNLGIGTTAPTSRLHVVSSVGEDGVIIDAATYPEVLFRNSGTTRGYLAIAGSAGGYATGSLTNSLILRSESPYSHLVTNGTNIALTANGSSIGIGTTGPSAKLHIAGGGQILGTNGTTSNTRTLTVLEDGDTQINYGPYPGSWTAALQIQDNAASRFLWLSPLDANSGANSRLAAANTGFDIYTNATSTTVGTLTASFTAAGSVGIGTTTPGFKLHVPSGYIGTDYINTTDNSVASGVTGVMVKQGDNYLRTGTAAALATFLNTTGTWIPNNGNGDWQIASSSTSTSYSAATLELRESNFTGTGAATPPHLGLHWGGVVASNITIESSGRVAITNDPGTGYENFVARDVSASRDMYSTNEIYLGNWLRHQ